jgi:cytoskeletal protein CcmA (bactofilin family)
MFRRREDPISQTTQPAPTERVTSVLGPGIVWKGSLSGSGGVRIEGAFEGDIAIRGLLVVGESGRVTCQDLRANVVIVAGAVRGDITAEKVEIRASGRVWGNVTTAAFATEEGAFLRGQITMEEHVDIGLTGQVVESFPAATEPAAIQETQPTKTV